MKSQNIAIAILSGVLAAVCLVGLGLLRRVNALEARLTVLESDTIQPIAKPGGKLL